MRRSSARLAAAGSVKLSGCRPIRRISDEVIDELLAGASSEEEIAGPGGLLARADQAAGRAGDGGRADRPRRL